METIMVQEADAATLDVVTTALQMEGYRVCSLTDTNENALEMIRRYHPKLVLLDCWLRHHSDKQISHWIKSHFPRLPVIALSSDKQIDQEYHKLGFDGYLKKPFDMEVLYRVTQTYLHRRRKRHPMAEPA
ncbi:response regulator [Mucilaginibacter sp. OK098]|uniref:response regulator n=1 Tax=Mucilaginibacter sp. OK098 TaxID=1855297 RepID=UPI0009224D89|nr:response regulator [Mucilaginibacter sp. OK098]SHM98705.1 Response regulator receiver domain-containing protein [Mucilaginibacter sp. OK098]